MNNMFHKHKWKEIARTYAKSLPEQGATSIERASDKHIFGFTTIMWECEVCQQIKKEELLGRLTPASQDKE